MFKAALRHKKSIAIQAIIDIAMAVLIVLISTGGKPVSLAKNSKAENSVDQTNQLTTSIESLPQTSSEDPDVKKIVPQETKPSILQNSPTPFKASTPTRSIPAKSTPSPTLSSTATKVKGNTAKKFTWTSEESGAETWGPDNNYWKGSNAFIDSNNEVHLKLTKDSNGTWYSSSIGTNETVGYGTYSFTVSSNANLLDKNLVFGAYTWDPRDPNVEPGNSFNREIDMVEISRWGKSSNDNAEFTVQTTDLTTSSYSYTLAPNLQDLTFQMTWSPGKVEIIATPSSISSQNVQWVYTNTNVPDPGQTQFRFNLWMYKTVPPSDGKEVELTVKNFQYVPG